MTDDRDFSRQSFLGEEALSDSGLSLSYVIPPELVGNNYIELIGELISGEGNGSDGPVVNNSALVDSPAINTHALWNHDVASDWNLEVGGSFLAAKRNDDNQQNAPVPDGSALLHRFDELALSPGQCRRVGRFDHGFVLAARERHKLLVLDRAKTGACNGPRFGPKIDVVDVAVVEPARALMLVVGLFAGDFGVGFTEPAVWRRWVACSTT